MSSFFTSLESRDDLFVGIVYNSSNNIKLYETVGHSTQQQAIKDANNFIKTGASSKTTEPTTTTNTIKTKVTTPGRRCCGR